jgi:hypothetical protein
MCGRDEAVDVQRQGPADLPMQGLRVPRRDHDLEGALRLAGKPLDVIQELGAAVSTTLLQVM